MMDEKEEGEREDEKEKEESKGILILIMNSSHMDEAASAIFRFMQLTFRSLHLDILLISCLDFASFQLFTPGKMTQADFIT